MIKIGFIHSLSGTMSFSEKLVAEAGIMAVEEINAQGGVLGHPVEYMLMDGASDPETFAAKAKYLITECGTVALFGGWNSHTRKAVKSIVEQYDSSFWYPMSYEGLEGSPNIFYTGSTINQQVMPAIEWCISQGFRSYYLLGSDYIFPITTNKLVHSILLHHSLHLSREVYKPLGHTEFESVIRDIRDTKPDIVINTLNGDSNLYFFRQLKEAGINANALPALSTSIAEPESQIMGDDSVGHYACWTYFQSVDSPMNREFCDKYQSRFGRDKVVSDPIVMAYSQLFMWKQAVEAAGTVDTDAVRRNARGQTFDIPPGRSTMRDNQHMTKRAYIGRVCEPGRYEIVFESPHMVEPLPWLGVENQYFSTSHLIIDILSRFPDAVDFNQCLQYQISERTMDLRDTLDKLHQIEKMQSIGELAGGIAHDFNNILGGILGYADLLSEAIPKETVETGYVEQIIHAAERAKSLVAKILTFSKRNIEQKVPIHLQPVLQEAVSLLKATFPSTITFHCDVDESLPPIVGNSSTIHEIILNIATNALHAMDEVGNLYFRCREQRLVRPLIGVYGDIPVGAYEIIEIEDEGCGIPDDILSKMFEPFFTTRLDQNGTGLGLAVVYGAMKEHNGNIQVETRLGRGTRFRLFFPTTCLNTTTSPMAESAEAVTGISILLVDDDSLLREACASNLGALGHIVTECEDGQKAIERFVNDDCYDLIITDQAMPRMTGVELAEQVLKIKPSFPIILCTGYSSKIDSEKAAALGISQYLHKPVRKKEIAQVISKLFKKTV